MQFVDVASRGGSPAAWLIRGWLVLASVRKQILIWVLILAAAFVLSKVIITVKQKDREQAMHPAALLEACKLLGYTSREECMHPGRASEARRNPGETSSETQAP